MKVDAWVATYRSGSRYNFTVKIDDEDLEGLSEYERNRVIDEYVYDALPNYFEWGWEPE